MTEAPTIHTQASLLALRALVARSLAVNADMVAAFDPGRLDAYLAEECDAVLLMIETTQGGAPEQRRAVVQEASAIAQRMFENAKRAASASLEVG